MFETHIKKYLTSHSYSNLSPKAVLFDMDGVLFNSMPYHAKAWCSALHKSGLQFEEKEAYLNEGRTGTSTINIIAQRQYGRDFSDKEIDQISVKGLRERKYKERYPVNLQFAHLVG